MLKKKLNIFIYAGLLAVGLSSCYDPNVKASEEDMHRNVGTEYAPQMYHSEAYDPLKQITDKDAGLQHFPFNEVGDGHGEWYNSNHYNEHGMNMRKPVENTVRRGELPYRIPKDSIELSWKLESPFKLDQELRVTEQGDSTMGLSTLGQEQLKECKNLYLRFCAHCHGKNGQADGKVAEKFGGVPVYNSAAIKDKPIGHIFHVITHGKGRMGAHGSQVSQLERWKIATFVQTLQKK